MSKRIILVKSLLAWIDRKSRKKIRRMKKISDGSVRLDRKIIEKKRRIYMKEMCCKLSSLVPPLFQQSYKIDVFEQSTIYIDFLTKRISELKEKKEETLRLLNASSNNGRDREMVIGCEGVNLPIVEVKEMDASLRVLLIIRRSFRNFRLYEVVCIIEEGGAEVVNVGYTTVDDKVYYTLHAQAKISRVGVEISSIRERLQKLVNENL